MIATTDERINRPDQQATTLTKADKIAMLKAQIAARQRLGIAGSSGDFRRLIKLTAVEGKSC